jgi:hypothetical protein
MAVRDTQGERSGPATLPDVVPFDLAHLTRQSWELGRNAVRDEEATRLGTWSHRTKQWQLSCFEVTSETAILRIRTPVGRVRFYGALQSELGTAIRELEANPSWQRSA